MTVYDGSGAGDPAYVGPDYAQSPALKGALNVEKPNTYHNDLRLDPAIVKEYRTFVEAAEATLATPAAAPDVGKIAAVGSAVSPSSSGSSPLAATGGNAPQWPAAVLALVAVGLGRQRRRAVT
jgi:hypothetical protein